MPITVRLRPEQEEQLRLRLAADGLPLSDFVRDAIDEKLTREVANRPSPYELGKHLFGKYSSGKDDLGLNHSKYLREKIRARHRD